MKKLLLLFTAITLFSCTPDEPTTPEPTLYEGHGLNIPTQFWGEYDTKDKEQHLSVTENTIILETDERSYTITEGTQGMQYTWLDSFYLNNGGVISLRLLSSGIVEIQFKESEADEYWIAKYYEL